MPAVRIAALLFLTACADEPTPNHALEEGLRLRDQGEMAASLACMEDAGDPFELALALDFVGRHAEAAGIYGSLLSEDPMTLLNWANALYDAGHDSTGIVWEVAAHCPRWDHHLRNEALALLAFEADRAGNTELAEDLRQENTYAAEEWR